MIFFANLVLISNQSSSSKVTPERSQTNNKILFSLAWSNISIFVFIIILTGTRYFVSQKMRSGKRTKDEEEAQLAQEEAKYYNVRTTPETGREEGEQNNDNNTNNNEQKSYVGGVKYVVSLNENPASRLITSYEMNQIPTVMADNKER